MQRDRRIDCIQLFHHIQQFADLPVSGDLAGVDQRFWQAFLLGERKDDRIQDVELAAIHLQQTHQIVLHGIGLHEKQLYPLIQPAQKVFLLGLDLVFIMAEIREIGNQTVHERLLQQLPRHRHATDDDAGVFRQRIHPTDHPGDVMRIHLRDGIHIIFGIQQPYAVFLLQLTDQHIPADALFQQHIHHHIFLHAQQFGQIGQPDAGTVDDIQIHISVNQDPSHSTASICS